jgi:hypothetical protein
VVTYRCTPNRSKPVTSSSVGLSSPSSLESWPSGVLLFGELPARGVPDVPPTALVSWARWRGNVGDLKRTWLESGPADVERDSGVGRRIVNETVGVDMVVNAVDVNVCTNEF